MKIRISCYCLFLYHIFIFIYLYSGFHTGRLILTDYAFYFEALRVVSYDKAKQYDLSDDLKQVIKPELTGPWGTRLFDRAVLYKSISL